MCVCFHLLLFFIFSSLCLPAVSPFSLPSVNVTHNATHKHRNVSAYVCVFLCKKISYHRLYRKHEILTLTSQNINTHTMLGDRKRERRTLERERRKKEKDRRLWIRLSTVQSLLFPYLHRHNTIRKTPLQSKWRYWTPRRY